MSSFLGHRVPDYNPFWDEEDYRDQSEWWQWYHLGYSNGYAEGHQVAAHIEALEHENEVLRGMLAANVRVIKAEIQRELKEAEDAKSLSERTA